MASSMRGPASRVFDAVVTQALISNNTRKLNRSLGRCFIYGVHLRPPVQGFASRAASQHSPTTPIAHRILKRKCVHDSQQCCHLSTAKPQLYAMHKPGTLEELDVQNSSGLSSADLLEMFADIKKELRSQYDLEEIAKYYFDGQGKAVRPLITVLMSRAINNHMQTEERLYESQLQIAKIAEMLHTASLVHDDVIDDSDTRRGKPSVNNLYGQRKAVMAGDYILSVASAMLARIRNEEVIVVLAQVLSDLVQGEFMQLGSKENENERFAHYLKKTFKKTASLLAYSCKAVAILSGADEKVQEVAFQYGRNVGIAFQLVDDMLDFVSSSNMLGKPVAADLKLGLATAPVLFACEKFPELNPMIIRRFQEPGDKEKAFEFVHNSDALEQTLFLVRQHCQEAIKFPELNPMIMRRFQEPGDVEKAFEFVHKSDGLEQTQFLARQHCQEAIRVINSLKPSSEQKALMAITDKVLHRMK